MLRRRSLLSLWCGLLCMLPAFHALAHGISEADKQTMLKAGASAYIWLGATHMLTGYDHLLFLFGIIFFLTGLKDVLKFVTAFTIGHSLTLLFATLWGITANEYLVDAVIALSVVYKGFENLDGFKKLFGTNAPNLLAMVFGFGLIHGFGLSTRLQQLALGKDGIVPKILAFNLGVEIGQVIALLVIVALLGLWRKSESFETFSALANSSLMAAGLILFGMQMYDYFEGHDHHHHHDRAHEHRHTHGADAPSHVQARAKLKKAKVRPSSDSNGTTQANKKAGVTHTHKDGTTHTHSDGTTHSHPGPRSRSVTHPAAQKHTRPHPHKPSGRHTHPHKAHPQPRRRATTHTHSDGTTHTH